MFQTTSIGELNNQISIRLNGLWMHLHIQIKSRLTQVLYTKGLDLYSPELYM